MGGYVGDIFIDSVDCGNMLAIFSFIILIVVMRCTRFGIFCHDIIICYINDKSLADVEACMDNYVWEVCRSLKATLGQGGNIF